jgi:hypothetical protein
LVWELELFLVCGQRTIYLTTNHSRLHRERFTFILVQECGYGWAGWANVRVSHTVVQKVY